jgi:uncharacterized phage protein (TIGR01671 family)
MREIKFRAWDKTKQVMIDSSVDDRSEYDEAYGDTRAINLAGIEEMAKTTRYEIMQYTGLHDKNGKEIYEGDIVHIRGQDEPHFVVAYDFNAFKLSLPHMSRDKSSLFFSTIKKDWYTMEIIGSIYETPNLLTNEEK